MTYQNIMAIMETAKNVRNPFLIGLITRFPSLALELLGRDDLRFQSFDSWKAQDDMTPELHVAPAQSEIIAHIRKTLQGSDYQHIRVIGEPGIGKTRLVLEALSAEDLAPLVIYSPHAEDFQRSRLFNELLRQDLSYHAIMVIDECAEKERASIWGALKGRRHIRLITIDHGPEDSRDDQMLVIDCPRLPEDQIMAIIASYLPQYTRVWHWAEARGGSPRVAHVFGENLQRNPEDLLKSPATAPMWERFVAGYERLDSKSARDALTVLRHAALFTRFGFDDPVSGEAQSICRLAQKVDPSMTWLRFQEVVERLRKRRILQGKKTLVIVPPALHTYLWIDYWNSYGRGFDFEAFLGHIPSPLQHWFLQQFIYAHASPVAGTVVRKILSPEGPFSHHNFLVSKAGTRFLNYLAEADPGATLAVIERTFGTWSQEELNRWVTGRQDIVWALEKIAVWREHFLRTAHVLVKLALAENAANGNNSTGILLGLFETGPGWAATQASPGERFPIIEELLGSHERLRRELGLQLCTHWLSTYRGARSVGAEYQGIRPEVEFWRPQTWSEVIDAWRLVWRHLFTETRSWDAEERRLANRTLIEVGARAVIRQHGQRGHGDAVPARGRSGDRHPAPHPDCDSGAYLPSCKDAKRNSCQASRAQQEVCGGFVLGTICAVCPQYHGGRGLQRKGQHCAVPSPAIPAGSQACSAGSRKSRPLLSTSSAVCSYRWSPSVRVRSQACRWTLFAGDSRCGDLSPALRPARNENAIYRWIFRWVEGTCPRRVGSQCMSSTR